jgi:hypothetical protein
MVLAIVVAFILLVTVAFSRSFRNHAHHIRLEEFSSDARLGIGTALARAVDQWKQCPPAHYPFACRLTISGGGRQEQYLCRYTQEGTAGDVQIQVGPYRGEAVDECPGCGTGRL